MTHSWPPACHLGKIPVSHTEMPKWQSVLLHLQQHQFASGVQGENAAEQDSHLGFFHYHQRQLGTAKERDLESHFSARTPLPCSSPWHCRRPGRRLALVLCTHGRSCWEAPPAFARPGGAPWGSPCSRGLTAAGPAPLRIPPARSCLPTAHRQHGPFLRGSRSLARKARPGPAEVRRSRAAGAAGLRGGAEERNPSSRGSAV